MTRTGTSDEKAPVAKAAAGGVPAGVASLDARRPPHRGREAPFRRQIPAEDLDLIVRRAAEIQNRHGDPGSPLLSEEEVVEIGRQVGLQPDYVRRAMAEVHAESLAPKRPAGNRILDLIAGDSRVEVRRVMAGDPTSIQQRTEKQLREEEKLTALRCRPMRSVWEASGSAMARLERMMNFSGKEYVLADMRQVELAVAEIEPGWTLTTITADVANKRDELLYGAAAAVGGIGTLAAVFSGQESVVLAIVAALLVGLTCTAVAIPWMHWVLDKRRARVELVLEGLLDEADR